MTAFTTSLAQRTSGSGARPFAGFRALVRKDVGEWTHGPRLVVVATLSSAFLGLAAANNWLNAWVMANVKDANEYQGVKVVSLDPLVNLAAAVASQFFVFVAIFVAMSLLVREREAGTLAWVASKPVTRTSILLAKWASATAVLWVAAGIVPLAVSAVAVTVLYGVPPIGAIVLFALGIGAVIALFVAVALVASVFVTSQPAVAGIAFAAFAVPSMVNGLIPFDIAPFEPSSVLGWTMGLAGGAPVTIVTPIAWLVGMVALAVAGTKRIAAAEL
jgi:ABC-type transport system involved in multi-copper enzyme maturation permease subunit